MNVQTVRLIDVFFIAPLLVYAATKKQLSKNERAIVGIIGVATFVYNGMNYLSNKQPEGITDQPNPIIKL